MTSTTTPTATFPPTITNGTTTLYQPLTTSFSAPNACSYYWFAEEYVDGNTTSLDALTAWSPWYEAYLNNSAGCLPDVIISSETDYENWFSASLSSLLITTLTTATQRTSTVFAPFDCFDGWEAVYSSVLSDNSSVTQSVCCPTQYNAQINTVGLGDYNGVDVTKKTIECVSPYFPQDTLTYGVQVTETSDGSTTTTAETHSASVYSPTLTVTAIAYTGYNIATATDDSTSSSQTSSTDSSGSDNGDTSSSSSSNSSGLSTGAKAGIGVGVAGGVVLIAIAAVLWLMRRRRQQAASAKTAEAKAAAGFESEDKKGGGGTDGGVFGADKKTAGPAEMQGDNGTGVFGVQEMHNGVDQPELMGSSQVFAQELDAGGTPAHEVMVDPETDVGSKKP